MNSRNGHDLGSLVLFAIFTTLSALGCASSSETAHVLEPRNIAGTAHVPHTEPLRVRESAALVERASSSSGRAMSVTRRARAR